MKPYHVAVSAEAFAAGMLAQIGCDVSVQYGANQPEYDLIATKGDRFLKVSVKGSQDGGWGFVQKYKEGRSYDEAIDEWAKRQRRHIIYCFVQFEEIALGACPRVYLATVKEIARHLKTARDRHGTTILYEEHQYRSGVAAGKSDTIPAAWRFTRKRLEQLLRGAV